MKIRTRKNPSGLLVYQLDLGLVNGRRLRHTFHSKAAAQSALVKARAQTAAQGIASLAQAPEPYPSLAKWMARLEGSGKSIDDVFRWYFDTYQERQPLAPPAALLQDYQKELVRLRRTKKYINQSLATLDVFFAAVPTVRDVSRESVLPFLQSNGYSPATQQNKLVTIKAFLEWCVTAGHIASNPLSGGQNRIRVAKTQKSEILSLGTDEVRRLLLAALKPEHEKLSGWLALALFAGVRPDELSRTDRQWLHLKEGTLRITAKASKTSQTRVIELHPTAIAWLRHWEQTVPHDATFAVTGHRKRWERLRQDAGLGQSWVHDVLRHTFATMHYAAFQNASQLKALMGHSENENTLFSHYRAVQTVSGATVTKAMAAEFWEISPQKLISAP